MNGWAERKFWEWIGMCICRNVCVSVSMSVVCVLVCVLVQVCNCKCWCVGLWLVLSYSGTGVFWWIIDVWLTWIGKFCIRVCMGVCVGTCVYVCVLPEYVCIFFVSVGIFVVCSDINVCVAVLFCVCPLCWLWFSVTCLQAVTRRCHDFVCNLQ